MAKNPFLSAYLSAANRVVNTARGKAMNEGRRQARRQNTSAVNAWFDAVSPTRRPKRKRRG